MERIITYWSVHFHFYLFLFFWSSGLIMPAKTSLCDLWVELVIFYVALLYAMLYCKVSLMTVLHLICQLSWPALFIEFKAYRQRKHVKVDMEPFLKFTCNHWFLTASGQHLVFVCNTKEFLLFHPVKSLHRGTTQGLYAKVCSIRYK